MSLPTVSGVQYAVGVALSTPTYYKILFYGGEAKGAGQRQNVWFRLAPFAFRLILQLQLFQ